jgi:hypothetical protein
MTKAADFVNQRHVFMQNNPLQVNATGNVMPYTPAGGRKINAKNAANNAPTDENTPTVNNGNYNNGGFIADQRLSLTVRSHPGNLATPNDTWVYFNIEDSYSVYDDWCGGVSFYSAANGVGGNTRKCYYLPFFANKISQITLGNQADYFFTDNLSGCTVFIDNTTTPANPVVCHGNAKAISADPNPNVPRDYMRGMYAHLGHNVDLRLEKADYWNANAQATLTGEVTRKGGWNLSHGWRDIQMSGLIGAFVVGFRDTVTDTWSFYYQTLGVLQYSRPWFSPSRYSKNLEANRLVVADSGQIV